MEVLLEELKAPIEMHFGDGVPHPTTMQAKDVPLQLGNWRGKVDLLVFTLRGMDCIFKMEFITQNNVLIEGHNRIMRIPSKVEIVRMKAHEVPNVGGPTIHLMLGIFFPKECMGGCGMLCVMRVLDEFEPKEVTNVVVSLECIKRILDEFPDVMPEELPKELPPRRRVDHAIEVMSGVALDTYKLELPENLKVHPTFHVSFSKLVSRDASKFNQEHNSRPSADLIHNELEF
jgi:hypothetical protein